MLTVNVHVLFVLQQWNGEVTKSSVASEYCSKSFREIAVNIAEPFQETEQANRYILILMDYFSKWLKTYSVPNQEVASVDEALLQGWKCRSGNSLELQVT